MLTTVVYLIYSKNFTIITAVESINFVDSSNFNFTILIMKYSSIFNSFIN